MTWYGPFGRCFLLLPLTFPRWSLAASLTARLWCYWRCRVESSDFESRFAASLIGHDVFDRVCDHNGHYESVSTPDVLEGIERMAMDQVEDANAQVECILSVPQI